MESTSPVFGILKARLKAVRRWAIDAYWSAYGSRLENYILPNNANSCLFVCKGNICRSPFAEGLARRIAEGGPLKGVAFRSAGIEKSSNGAPTREAIAVAEEFGVNLNPHRAVGIMDVGFEEFDVIVVMESWHWRWVKKAYPEVTGRLFLLALFESDLKTPAKGWERYNIADPYGKGFLDYRACFTRIEKCIVGLLAELERTISKVSQETGPAPCREMLRERGDRPVKT